MCMCIYIYTQTQLYQSINCSILLRFHALHFSPPEIVSALTHSIQLLLRIANHMLQGKVKYILQTVLSKYLRMQNAKNY